MNILHKLTKEELLNCTVPVKEILSGSLFYGACEFDGNLIRHTSQLYSSYVYCDYATGEVALDNIQDSFVGYRLIMSRKVNEEELATDGLQPQFLPNYNEEEYHRYSDKWKAPFVRWLVYERETDYGDNHGPHRFSLLYIGGEAVNIYQNIYNANKITPKALAIIQPGYGFGWNWTNFKDINGPLAWVVFNNPAGTPDTIYYGGYGKGFYNNLSWPGYSNTNLIIPYYKIGGEATVWTKSLTKKS